MKERMKISGFTPRDEMIRDGQNLLKEELEHDIRYFSIMEISRKYNCSDNMIRKMLRAYNLPFKRKDITKFKQENIKYTESFTT